MKFGVREIADVTFKAKADTVIGSKIFRAGQPVLFIDTATTSNLEQAATTVYAQGGKGYARLIAWEGEKTLTFTVEDALLSPIGLAILSGAGLFKKDADQQVHVHKTALANINSNGIIDLTDALETSETIDATAPVFVARAESDGSISGNIIEGLTAPTEDTTTTPVIKAGKYLKGDTSIYLAPSAIDDLAGMTNTVFVDFYVVKNSKYVSEIQIDASNFAGYYYVEASTLFRRESDGVDMLANITMPNVKIQSNFTFAMAATGDPSTFSFTMDAFPGYTYFDRTKKVMCVIQVVEDATAGVNVQKSVMGHTTGFDIATSHGRSGSTSGSIAGTGYDSTTESGEEE